MGPVAALALLAGWGCDARTVTTAVGTRSNLVCQPHDVCELAAALRPDGSCQITRAPDGTACNTSNSCTTDQTCLAGKCQGGNALPDGSACDDGNPCTQDQGCLGGACQGTVLADGTACDDQSVCTDNTTCLAGVCQGGQTLACPAQHACHVDGACDPKAGCIDVPMTGACVPELAALTLDGCCSADYSAPIKLGDDTYMLIVDSGSTTTAVAGASCSQGCDDLSPLYRPSAAATSRGRKTDSYYGDRSGWAGTIYRDRAMLPGIGQAFDFSFAAMTTASVQSSAQGTSEFFLPNFCTGVARDNTRQGILGLAGAEVATHPEVDALMDVLSAHGFQEVFSTQLCNTAGRLWFGGFDPQYLAGAPAYTPMKTGDGFYRIVINDLLLDGRSLGLSPSLFGGMPVVDNGTSNMHFPTPVFDAVAGALAANDAFTAQFSVDETLASGACARPRDPNLSREELDRQLPSLTFVLPDQDGSGSFHVTLPATASYLTLAATQRGDYYCGTLMSNQSDGSSAQAQSNPSIIGNAAMRAHVVIFDREKQLLGFAPQRNCIGPGL